jgi:protein-S-isoprenylcysteine O-methyltransferase Ste14
MARPVNQKRRILILRLVVLAVLLPLYVFIQPKFEEDSAPFELMMLLGVLVLIAGVLGRFWATLYIGGKKNQTVMQDGPYSMTRNPLYFFSTVAACGIGLMSGSVIITLVTVGLVGTVLWQTARREAAFLSAEFGESYAAYAARVPFFVPDPRLFQAAPETTFTTRALKTNLRDAAVFLLFIPLIAPLDLLHETWPIAIARVW